MSRFSQPLLLTALMPRSDLASIRGASQKSVSPGEMSRVARSIDCPGRLLSSATLTEEDGSCPPPACAGAFIFAASVEAVQEAITGKRLKKPWNPPLVYR